MPPGTRGPRPLLLLAAAVAAVIACDDAQPAPPLAEQIAQAFCGHQFACCAPLEISALTSDRYATEDDCVPFATLSARQQLATLEGAIDQGRITVDPTRATACIDAYRDSRCNDSPQAVQPIGGLPDAAAIIATCPDLLVGHVANGRACNLSQECLRGSRCVATPPPTVYPGLTPTVNSLAPNPGICVANQRSGEPCNQSSDCDQRGHLVCRAPAYTCGPPAQAGEPCTAQRDPLTGVTIGQDCDPTQNLFCDTLFTFTCQRYPREGEFCSQVQFPQCDPDPALNLVCIQFTNVCKKAGDEGAPCGASAIPPCRADLACHPTQSDGIGTCEAPPVLGQPCVDKCVSPAICYGRVCTMPGPRTIGEACTSNTQCASLQCESVGNIGSATRVCSPPIYLSVVCAGADVTPSIPQQTGTGGIGGTFGSGDAGSTGTMGIGGRAPPPTGTAGAGGTGGGVSIGCPISLPAMGDPVIADFDMDPMGSLLIGGTFTYPEAGSSPAAPVATVTGGALQVTVNAPGETDPQYLGAGIFFFGNPPGLGCIDASFHKGVQFDISGTVAGEGCTTQYSTNDSEHTDVMFDAKASGPPGSYAPQATFPVTATPATIFMPFSGPGAPSGGSPALPTDPLRLLGVQWQFTVAAGTTNSCTADVTIDNVRFF